MVVVTRRLLTRSDNFLVLFTLRALLLSATIGRMARVLRGLYEKKSLILLADLGSNS